MRLEGKTAIVTGAGQGIGQAIALTLAKEGANVIVADVDIKTASETATRIKSMGHRAEAVKVDVSDAQDVSQMVEKALSAFNKIDILVNNAGIDLSNTPPENAKVDEFDKTIAVNLRGTFLCSQAVGRQMLKHKSGKIINIASTAGHRGFRGKAAYCASKAGVLGLTRVCAIEWAKHGINVNAVCPGTTRTALVAKLPINLDDRVKRTPSGKLNQPQDIANTVLFLASSESDNMVGAEVVVDGGVSALFWPNGE